VADLIKSSAAVKTCRDFENGMPRRESLDCANIVAKANENPFIASGDFFKYSSRLIHRSTRGVANDGMATTIHLFVKWEAILFQGYKQTSNTKQSQCEQIEWDGASKRK
jgi:hypothetical protein